MTYEIINNLPIDYEFATKSTKELRTYRDWFNENKEKRLKILYQAVISTKGFEDWKMDFTSQSLKPLYKWFCEQLEIRKLTQKEYKEKQSKIPKELEIKINDWDFTIRTYSLFVDISFYFGEVFIHQYNYLHWEQFMTRSKRHVNRGHMVICGFKNVCLEPLRIVRVIGYKTVDDGCDEDRYYNIYKVWEKKLNS